LYNTLTREFIDVVKNYQNAQQQYKRDIQRKIKRQVLIVKPDATDEEVDAIIKSEGGRDSLYREKILAGRVSDQVK
jgi:syntaxin 1B/2/3